MANTAKVIFSDTGHDADLRYWAGISVIDPFLAIGGEGKRLAIIHGLERDRLRQHSRFDEVHLWEDFLAPEERSGSVFQKIASALPRLQKDYGFTHWQLPASFPAAALLCLQERGLSFEVLPDPFLPERAIKGEEEIAELRRAAALTSEAMALAREILLRSEIAADGGLVFEGKPLSSEFLKESIELFCFQRGALAENTIAAGGAQSGQPHGEGQGPLRAHQPIVIDLFPRLKSSGYWGDMTRTFLRGEPSPPQQKRYDAVLEAHRRSVAQVRAGASAAEIHDRNVAFFEAEGWPVCISLEGCTGFIHNTGHGIGLDIHEEPRLAHGAGRLAQNMVITVEPGLYYPDGGVRIEDTLLVREEDGEKLTEGSYDWVL
ncbi:MAG: Xaa-Pro peptidase family protein [Puniceicoccales bacterium]|jgi:Xaa-Pro aminopeptidase|nr:Xaa-Pro peptidase family protein [Puniceicoccales bacterium]